MPVDVFGPLRERPRRPRRTFLWVWCSVLSAGLLSAQDEAAVPSPWGEFEVVAIRKASLVLSGPEDLSLDQVGPGSRVRFGNRLEWLWNRNCENWSVHPLEEPEIPLDDSMLSDAQITAARLDESLPDHRRNDRFSLSCGGLEMGRAVQVDDRVLITISRSGQSYLILERIVDEELARAVQRELRSRKFLEQEPNGSMDAPTRRALSLFAGDLGADYDFNATALSENLLEGLGLGTGSVAAGWTDAEISAEMARLRFAEPFGEGDESVLVASEFFASGERAAGQEAGAATRRLAALRAFLETLPNVEYSVVAERLRVLKVERRQDRPCPDGERCRALGQVVGLASVQAGQARDLCELLHSQGWFCALH